MLQKFRHHRGILPQDCVNAAAHVVLRGLRKYKLTFDGFPEISLEKVGDDYHLKLSKGPNFSKPIVLHFHLCPYLTADKFQALLNILILNI